MRAVTVFLCGDVMLGRGVDQILPHPGNPTLHEQHVRDARQYVELAQLRNGPIPYPVGDAWPWGDALQVLDDLAPEVRIINLETSITQADDFAPGKGVHYRMSPGNVPCLAAAAPDVCALANNHVLDFGSQGLADTLDVLRRAGIRGVGAGHDLGDTREPAVIPISGGGRVMVVSCGLASSGIPPSWAAASNRSGVNLVADLSERSAAEIIAQVGGVRKAGDMVVVSIHWGTNWGYEVPAAHRRFAHRLIEGGVDIVHGHSSHHPRPIEIYRGKLVLYGCGDFIDDYEGIAGYESYRADLRLMYFVSFDQDAGAVQGLRIIPMQARTMRLRHASLADSAWLGQILNEISRPFATRVDAGSAGALTAASRSTLDATAEGAAGQ
ncbi:MAG TPA: CapA family protein [Jatrophihabitantaceae bacterium]|nr:CapA family protein [Jatrophihabitantaceae bacterium]